MSRYVPVPHDALEATRIEEWHAVVDLFKRGHALRWRSFEVTERSLGSRWSMTGRRVWGLLQELETLGHVVLERGTGRTASRVTVLCPTAEQSRQQSGQQNESDSKPKENEREAHSEAQNGELLTRHETEPEPRKENTAPPLRLVPDPPPEQPSDPPTEVDPTPKWARGHRGTPAIVVLGAVVRALEAIRQKPVDPTSCKTDATPILSLWKARQVPIEQLADELIRVAEWAREAPGAENDIRGKRSNGEQWGKDRSRAVSTLCAHDPFGDRLAEADEWIAAGRPRGRMRVARPFDPPREPNYRPDLDAMTPFEREVWLAANEEQR